MENFYPGVTNTHITNEPTIYSSDKIHSSPVPSFSSKQSQSVFYFPLVDQEMPIPKLRNQTFITCTGRIATL